MSNMKVVPIIAAGDNAVRTEAQDALDKLRLRVEKLEQQNLDERVGDLEIAAGHPIDRIQRLEEAAGQAMIKADRLHLGIDQLNQRITRLELAFSHELAVLQGRIAAVESEISDLASIDGQKLQ